MASQEGTLGEGAAFGGGRRDRFNEVKKWPESKI